MTTLKDRINDDMRKAMKSGDTTTRDTLRVLMAEVHRGQLTKDDEIVPIIKKMIENIEETGSSNSVNEVNVLQVYMPVQLTEGDMIFKVAELVKENNYTSMKDMGAVMGYFAANFPNQYDGKKLSIITKNQLSK